jgi:dihydrofolate reductase
MRSITVSMWITLDGFIAGRNSKMNWVRADEANDAYESELISSADTLSLGRATYESSAGSWPHVPDKPTASENETAYARRLNAMRMIVFSTTLPRVEWKKSTHVREVLRDDILRLKRQLGGSMVVYGSASSVQALTNLGLNDEYQLLVHPVGLGGGKPLFDPISERVNLTLIWTRPRQCSVVELYYRPIAQERSDA